MKDGANRLRGLDRLPATDPTTILRHRDGIYAVDLLTAAIVEFRLFDVLADRPGNLDEIRDRFGWHERPTTVLLTLCLAYGYLDRDENGIFFPTPIAREHLCEDSPWNLTPYYRSLRDRTVVQDFVRVLKTGHPAHWTGHDDAAGDWHASMQVDEFAGAFTAAMDCRGVYLGKKLADTVSDILSDARLFLDIGGGSGVYACALAANANHLHGIVLEQAPVDALAWESIERRALAERVSVHTGDMFHSDWPAECDLHLFSNVMHDWDAPEISRLLHRSHETLLPGGRVLIHETFLDSDRRGPLPVAEYSAILMHSTRGRCYAWSEMIEFLEKAGFSSLGYRPTGGDRGVVIAEKSQ